jgi:UDPglucose 6-dehydrogenase
MNVEKIFRTVDGLLSGISECKVAIWGLSTIVNCNYTFESEAVELVKRFYNADYQLSVYDPVISRCEEISKLNIKFAKNEYDAVKGAECLIIMNKWKRFSTADFEMVYDLLVYPYIYDKESQLDRDKIEEIGFVYDTHENKPVLSSVG